MAFCKEKEPNFDILKMALYYLGTHVSNLPLYPKTMVILEAITLAHNTGKVKLIQKPLFVCLNYASYLPLFCALSGTDTVKHFTLSIPK